MKLPDYLVLGECKCGTSSIYSYLTQHPQILKTYGNGLDNYLGTKELRFFDRYYDKGLDWYASRFPDTQPDEITGECASVYFGRTISLYRIKKDIPHVKTIVLLRNPVDRLYSHYCHKQKWIPNWGNQYSSFEHFITSAYEEDNYLIEKGIYITMLSKWFKEFPGQVMVVESESLFNDSQNTCNLIFDYLGIKQFELESFKKLNNSSISIINPTAKEILQEFYRPYNEELYSFLGYRMSWDD